MLRPEATAVREPRKVTAHTHLYKYSSIAGPRLGWLKRTILDHRLYFPSPPELNDPLDARPMLKLPSECDLVGFFLSDVLRRRGHQQDYPRDVRNILRVVRDLGPQRVTSMMQDSFNTAMSTHRIYSLTTRADNEELWARYADDHDGYCLEFLNGGLFAFSRHVDYMDDVSIDVTNDHDITAMVLFSKTQEWAHEEEVRILSLPRGQLAFHSFEPHLLRRVILGSAVSSTHARMIRLWAARRSPQLLVVGEVERPTPVPASCS